jgi:hypothetical protein
MAEEHFHLKKLFNMDSVTEQVSFLLDMVLFPIIAYINVLFRDPGGLLTLATSINKSVTLWIKWLRFQELNKKMRDWIWCVKQYGGPFISTNDSDYHMFVYADGMQRLRNSLKIRGDAHASNRKDHPSSL